MKICFYTSTALPKRGGQEPVVDTLARQFLQLGHEVVVLAPRPRRPLKGDDRAFPYPVVRHPRFYSMHRLVSWYRWFLLRLLKAGGFDVLHCHGIYPSGYLAALCRERISLPVVLTSHGSINGALTNDRWARRNVEALAAADALIALSALIENNYRRLCPNASSIVRIPNGVDLFPDIACRPPGLDPSINTGNYLLFLGRFHRRKGVDRLLQAFALAAGGQRFQLVLAGQGNQEPSLRTSVEKLGLDDRVRFAGWVEGDVKTYLLRNALCTVVPSRWPEAFPLVVLENYAASRPVIASAVGGLKELVTANETGILVEPDSLPAWAQAIRQLFDEPHRADLMGQQANRWVQNYSWKRVAERHIDLYAALLDCRTVNGAQLSRPRGAPAQA
jgi:glycosyltransferase involved in cell wall biosynthesis